MVFASCITKTILSLKICQTYGLYTYIKSMVFNLDEGNIVDGLGTSIVDGCASWSLYMRYGYSQDVGGSTIRSSHEG